MEKPYHLSQELGQPTTPTSQSEQHFPDQGEYDNQQAQDNSPQEQYETSPQEQESTDYQEAEPKETPQQKNFRALREKAERAEQLQKERDEALRYIEEIRQHAFNLQQQEEQKKKSDSTRSYSDDDLVEYGHIRQRDDELRKEVNKYRQELQQVQIVTQLRAQYADIDAVVNEQNLKALKEKDPVLAATLAETNNYYNKAVGAYNAIKMYGISSGDTQYDREKSHTQNNASKPRPLSSISPQRGESPLSRANAFANGLTDDLKKSLLKEMRDSTKFR